MSKFDFDRLTREAVRDFEADLEHHAESYPPAVTDTRSEGSNIMLNLVLSMALRNQDHLFGPNEDLVH